MKKKAIIKVYPYFPNSVADKFVYFPNKPKCSPIFQKPSLSFGFKKIISIRKRHEKGAVCFQMLVTFFR